jgi:hypothetical protein
MKIEAFETEFNVEDVVWFMCDNKPTRGIVYEINVHLEEKFDVFWTEKCINIIRKIRSYFDQHEFKKNISYYVQRVHDDDAHCGAGSYNRMTASQLFHTKEDLLKSL